MTYDLDLNPRLAKVKVDPRAKKQGHRSNGSNMRAPTDKRTDTHTHTHTRTLYQTYYLLCYAVDNNVRGCYVGWLELGRVGQERVVPTACQVRAAILARPTIT